MKKLALFFAIIFVCLKSYGQVAKPDFAYPATVSKTARQDISKAINKHDSKLALNSLIRYFISVSLIDQDSIPAAIKEAEKTAAHFTDAKDYGLFEALIANFYLQQYGRQRWIYDQRDIPQDSIPSDITEWDGKMYRTKIRSLCQQSYRDQVALSKCKLTDYKTVIKTDKISKPFYPTLLDFVWQNALSIYSDINENEEAKSLLSHIANNCGSKGSAPYILWNTEKIKYGSVLDPFQSLIALYDENATSKYSGYILYCINPDGIDVEEEKVYYKKVKEYLSKYPGSDFKDLLTYYCKKLTTPSVSVRYDNIVPQGTSVKVRATIKNADKYTISIYKYSANVTSTKNSVDFASLRFVKSISIDTDSIAPFECDTVLCLPVSEAGEYAFVPRVEGAALPKMVTICKVIEAYPIQISGSDHPMVALVDATTGKPISDVTLKIGRFRKSEKTDKVGLAVFPNPGNESIYNSPLSFEYKGVKYKFAGDWGLDYRSDDWGRHIWPKVFVDRAIYHPGEKVQALVILTETGPDNPNGKIVTGKKLSMSLCDANNSLISEIKAVTDDFGRATAEFDLPVNGLTGNFSILVQEDMDDESFRQQSHHDVVIDDNEDDEEYDEFQGYVSFIVSDYKLPDFKIDNLICTYDTPQKGDVTISGKVISYSGVPMIDAEINITVSQSSWWRMYIGDKIASVDGKTDDKGIFSIVIPSDKFADQDINCFIASVDATSKSGTTVTGRLRFCAGKKYLIQPNIVSREYVDGSKIWTPDVKVLDSEGAPVDLPLKWTLYTTNKYGSIKNEVVSGNYIGEIDLTKITPAQYIIKFETVDPELADDVTRDIYLYNTNTDIVPGENIIWVLDDNTVKAPSYETPVSKTILYGVTEDCFMYRIASDGVKTSLCDQVFLSKGYHNLDIEIPAGSDRVTVDFLTSKNCNVESRTVVLNRVVDRSLVIESESFRDNLVPDAEETWNIKIKSVNPEFRNNRGYALALDMYNQALDALSPHRFNLYIDSYIRNYHLNIRGAYKSGVYLTAAIIGPKIPKGTFITPEFETYGYSIGNFRGAYRSDGIVLCGLATPTAATPRRAKKASMSDNGGDLLTTTVREELYEECEQAEMLCEPVAVSVSAGQAQEMEEVGASETFAYRNSEEALAIWAPRLTTDAEGNVSYTFTVPNANTTWRLKAMAWNQLCQIGSLTRDFIASKPIMVQPNMPRFLRAGDKAVIEAIVMNKTDETQKVTTVVEIFNPYTSAVISRKTFTSKIDGMQQTTVNIDVTAPTDMQAIGYRVRCSNGISSDGEQNAIPVLSSDASLIETSPFYLNPGDTEYTTKLPNEKGARISLSFCENPVWTVVSALPGLRENTEEYANSAAAALFSAYIAKGILADNPEIGKALQTWRDNPTDSALVSMLTRNADLKIALLNATPWVQAAQNDQERMSRLALLFDVDQIQTSVDNAMKILEKLQRSDGGWSWGEWCRESSVWVTSNVLALFGELKSYGWLPTDSNINTMIKSAITFYDKKVEYTDIDYCLIRPLFSDIPISKNGKKVIDATISDIKKNWKGYSNPDYKARAAEALWLNGQHDLAREVLRSLTEFGVYTKDQGLKFPNVNSIFSYAMILDAYAIIAPGSKEVDGLRQQLIVRKQATDWGSAVVTSEVVASILSSGTKWTVDAQGATVRVGKTTVKPRTAIETATGSFTADLSTYGGRELQITTSGNGPAYGAIYTQFTRANNEVKAYGIDDLTIEKKLFVRRGTEWETAGDLKVGDRVKVQLTIHNKRNMQYVEIIDERPAAFEPVQQIPGWLWSEGVGFYRENRDSRTNLHVVYMSPGTYLLTYEMNVTVAGTFSSGVATIQSQYAPELSAHSSGSIINVLSKD